ncbi:MAG TPA: OsmC family protein [Polyangiales bacterium]|jgi:ribosomal protein S12 methylthiotransferase accessory factor|nr:OsmC family protein [Polyangiales bacterium]
MATPAIARTLDIDVTFPGGKRVDARIAGKIIHSDQSVEHGGEGSAPEPFDLFLSALATCAGLYILGFCQARQLPIDGIKLVQRNHFDESSHLVHIDLEIVLPDDFPEKYRAAIVRAAAGCKVKKTLAAPPEFVVTAKSPAGEVFASSAAAAA